MNPRSCLSVLVAGVVVLALGLSLAGCATENIVRGEAIEQKIAGAKTRADHERLAIWYEQEARAANDKAGQHRRLADGYGVAWSGLYGNYGMLKHCQNLVRKYEQASEENLALAKLHRQMAADAKE